MKIKIIFAKPEHYTAEAVELAIRRLLPKARRREPPVRNGFHHIEYSTMYIEPKRNKKEITK